jgi:uncharacterized protein (UPF0332 family)
MKRMTDPPIQKHTSRPRKLPSPPLSDTERRTRARAEFQKAVVLLAEAEKLGAWRGAPNACAHTAYYAMHHCAAAVILATGGVGKTRSSPANHQDVIRHFANLVEGESEDLIACGRALNRAFNARETADYGLTNVLTPNDAVLTANDATAFVRHCRERWGLDLV